MSNPFFSIIIAVYNGENTIQKCINSVTKQSYVNKELIIIDGNSNDNTVEIIKNNPDIAYWESKPDRGISHAWNKGISRVNGNWILFLGADDYLIHNDILSDIYPFFKSLDSSKKVVYGKVIRISEKGIPIKIEGAPWHIIKKRFIFQEMAIHHQGVFHHINLFKKNGGFDESFKITGDYELLLRELKNEDPVFLDTNISAAEAGGLSTQGEIRIKIYHEFIKAQKKQGIKGGLENQYLWLHWNAFKGKLKSFLSKK